jgi:hypothetical protein
MKNAIWHGFVSISFRTIQVPHCTLSKTKTQWNMLVLWMFYVRYWKQIFNVYPLKWPYLILAIIKIPQMKIPLEADYGWVECIVLINWLICYSRAAYPSGAYRFISVVLVNYFFCRAKRNFFFQKSTLGYMTKTLNQIQEE